MEKENKIVFSFRINEQLYEKVRRVAEKNRRSINSQMELYVAGCLEDYERDNGEINVDVLFEN